jgi:hypothetical protein
VLVRGENTCTDHCFDADPVDDIDVGDVDDGEEYDLIGWPRAYHEARAPRRSVWDCIKLEGTFSCERDSEPCVQSLYRLLCHRLCMY